MSGRCIIAVQKETNAATFIHRCRTSEQKNKNLAAAEMVERGVEKAENFLMVRSYRMRGVAVPCNVSCVNEP